MGHGLKAVWFKEFSRWLQEAFDLRQRADYREMFTVTGERAKSILDNGRSLVKENKKGHGLEYFC